MTRGEIWFYIPIFVYNCPFYSTSPINLQSNFTWVSFNHKTWMSKFWYKASLICAISEQNLDNVGCVGVYFLEKSVKHPNYILWSLRVVINSYWHALSRLYRFYSGRVLLHPAVSHIHHTEKNKFISYC